VNDLGLRVIIGAAWAFGVINVAPDLMFMLIGKGWAPIIPGLSDNQTEFVYVLALALLGPLVLWYVSRPKRTSWEWEKHDQ
jgi:hypothetical protein